MLSFTSSTTLCSAFPQRQFMHTFLTIRQNNYKDTKPLNDIFTSSITLCSAFPQRQFRHTFLTIRTNNYKDTKPLISSLPPPQRYAPLPTPAVQAHLPDHQTK